MNLADSIHGDRILDLTVARHNLEQRLLEGHEVGGITLAGLLDCEIDQGVVRSSEVAGLMVGVVEIAMDEHTQLERSEAIRNLLCAVVKRFLDRREDLIREEAEQALTAEEGE